MKRFYCHCGQEVFFDNVYCNNCGSQLGFDPSTMKLQSLQVDGNMWRSYDSDHKTFRSCEHRNHAIQCNWLIDADDYEKQCISCRLTRKIPTQEFKRNERRWAVMESAKRRMLYGLLQLGMPFVPEQNDSPTVLIFDFLEDQRSNPNVFEEHIYSGHSNGVITMNVAEADDSYREAAKEAMNEPYRTLLGHFRHEIGHYYWEQLIQNNSRLESFRNLFGDETLDYRATLDTYYVNGPERGWQESYISAYASAHPLEDWAETWAHYMHMSETLETAEAFDLIQTSDPVLDFDRWLNEWMQLVVVLNALNRSIGNSDAYPFVIPATARQKLKYIHQIIQH